MDHVTDSNNRDASDIPLMKQSILEIKFVLQIFCVLFYAEGVDVFYLNYLNCVHANSSCLEEEI